MFEGFLQLPLSRRIAIMMVLAAALAGLIAVGFWTQQPEMQMLFANLAPDDAGAIVEKLKELKIPYEVGGGGTSVLVPSPQVYDLRLQLAAQGLPHGSGIGYEIFDRTNIGQSEFVQKLNYRRAQQGELARTIAQMPEVQRARVHLAVPERRLFATSQERPRAAVVLSLKRENALTKTQVQGIVHLVANSVEGLKAEDVTVVDGHGRLLSESSGEGVAHLSSTQLEYQRNLEKDVETRITSMLERIVGSNKAVVRVSSVLDFRQVEHTEEKYDPNGQVVRSEQKNQERANGVNGISGGVPGVASNVPAGESPEPPQTSTQNSQTKNETVNYEISRTVSRIIEPVGTIKKMTVAVLVDGTYEAPAPVEGQPAAKPKYTARTEEEMKKIVEIVKKAMGFSQERGDEVQVENVSFGFEGEEGPGATAQGDNKFAAWAPYIRYGVGAVMFLLVLLFVVKPLVGTLTAPPTMQPHGIGGPGLASLEGATMGAGGLEALSGPQTAHIADMARSNPQSAAVVVKKWLKPA